MQTSRRLFTEAKLQRRIFLEISEIILFVSVIFRYSFIRISQPNFFHSYMKFTGHVLEKQGMCAIQYEYKKKHLSKFWAVRRENLPPTKQHANLEFLECECEMLKIFQKWHCVLELQAKSIKEKPCFNEGIQMQI